MAQVTPKNLVLGGLLVALAIGVGIVYIPSLFGGHAAPPAVDVSNPDKARNQIAGMDNSASNVESVAQYVSSADEGTASAAVMKLGQIGTEQAAARLETAVNDERPAIQAEALLALGNTNAEVKVDPAPARQALNDTARPVAVRAAAIQMLSRKHIYHSLPDLVAAMRDKSPVIRAKAYDAFKHILQYDYGFRANAPEADRNKVLNAIQADMDRMNWNTPGLPD